jgi:hypothetical protein
MIGYWGINEEAASLKVGHGRAARIFKELWASCPSLQTGRAMRPRSADSLKNV